MKNILKSLLRFAMDVDVVIISVLVIIDDGTEVVGLFVVVITSVEKDEHFSDDILSISVLVIIDDGTEVVCLFVVVITSVKKDLSFLRI